MGRHLTPSALHETAAEIAAPRGMLKQELLERSRRPRIVRARHLLFAVLRDRGYSYHEIARAIGMHHASVMYGVRNARIWNRLETRA